MKITTIETFKYWINWCNWLFVKVSTDEGVYGWGEGSLHGAIESVETAIHELGRTLIGQDPAGVEQHWQPMYQAWRWRGGPTLMTALGALDIALWDLEGKRLGVPVYRLLGGPYRTQLRAATPATGCRGSPRPSRHTRARRMLCGAALRRSNGRRFDPALLRTNEARAIAHAAELVAAAREGAGPETEIFVECAERLSPRSALLAAQAFAPYRPGWFEEPIPFENVQAMVQLQRALPVPIATGERLLSRWEVCALLEAGGCSVLQPDVMHAAGITEMKRLAMLADTYCIPIAPHNPDGPICMLAAMHVAAAIPSFLILEQMEEERALRDAICSTPVGYQASMFELPAAPRLGCRPAARRARRARLSATWPSQAPASPLWH